MTKQFWIVIGVIIAIFAGIYAFSGHKTNSSTNANNLTQHIMGSTSSGVLLVEYGDYQCPACEGYFPIVSQVVNEYKDRIQFQFRNFPITSKHPNAFAAARAAEAAGLQGKYWEMHDLLYTNSNWQDWTNTTDPNSFFDQYAKELGLNISQFHTDFASTKVNDWVTADMNYGAQIGVQGTPTFFIDGKQVSIAQDPAAFQKVLNAEIAQKAAAKKQ